MLFLLHKPTNLLIQSHQKLIITTPNQLIFTSINFIQEYLTRKLIYPSPQQIKYSKQTSETIIITKQSIEMYWTDWHLNIQLRCFINLVEERVYSNIWDGKWICFGDFQQYSTKNIKLVKIYNHQQEFPSCFLAQLQIILTNKRLVGYNHTKKILHKIKWSHPIDRLFLGHPKMTATTHNSGVIILSIDNIYLHIHNQEVIFTKQHEGELFINSQTAIWINPGKTMIIYSITEKELIPLGEIEVYEGHYIGSTVNGDKLILFFYQFRELQIKTINLVDPEVNIQYQNRRKEKDRIREEITLNREKQSEKIDSIINNLTAPDLNNMKGVLKSSISRFQEQMNKSFQSRHFELKQSLKESQIVLAQPKAFEQKVPTIQIQLQSLGMVSEELKDISGLFEHGESGFEWQQLEKEHFEQKNQDPSNIAKDLSISQTNEQNQLDFAETPAFNFQGTNSWGHYHQNWPESDVIREKSDSSLGQKYQSSQMSKKSGSELDKNNSSMHSAPDNRKITTILGEIYRKQPDRFDDALESNLQKLIHQDEARIFFADMIRIHNPDLTKDRLLRLYRLIPDTEENKKCMGKALSQFRLEQVPWACLAVKQTILKIYQKIYPTVYIQDLLNPNLILFEQFIQSYFSQSYNNQILQIQDQTIQICHPRNLLNIILYLNDEYSFPLQLVFQIYTKKLIRHEKLSIIKKLSESNVCQICHIDKKIFQKSAEQIARQILEQGIRNREHFQGIVGLMGGKKKKFYSDALILIEHFNQEGCKYNISQLLDLPVNKNASNFFKAIKQDNSPIVLASLNIPLIFKKLLSLEDSNSMYYQIWQIEACKQISQILLQNNYYKQAIKLLLPIAINIKRSFLAKLLLKYFNGDYLQLLISKNTDPSKTVASILQLIYNQQTPLTQSQSLQKDQITEAWKQFKLICSFRLNNTQWQLSYLIFNDKLLAKQLIAEGIFNQDDYQFLMTNLNSKKSNTFDWLNMNFTYKQIPLIISSDSSQNQRHSKLQQLLLEEDYPKMLLQQSYKGYDSIKQIQSMNLAQSVRYDEQQTDPNLILLKLQVQNCAVLEMLRQIYEQSPKDRFLLAIGLVDREKITLNNIELFKSMVHLDLGYPFEKLIPFDYFIDDDQACWKEVSRRIRWELSWQNFWVIYTLISMIYRRESEVAVMFIEKIIIYEYNDESEQQILKLVPIFNLQPYQISSLLQLATQRNLQKLVLALESQ